MNGNLLSLVANTGTCTVAANQSGNGNFEPAPTVLNNITIGNLLAFQCSCGSTDAFAQIYIIDDYFSTARIRGQFGFYIDPNNVGYRQVTQGAYNNSNPVWSPDGMKLVFRSTRDNQNGSELYLLELNKNNLIRLTTTNSVSTSVLNSEPVWSPDGSKIAFTSWRDGHAEIYIINSDGTNETRLTNSARDSLSPTWSPDSNKIAFSSFKDGQWDGQAQIYVVNVDGTNEVKITNNVNTNRYPVWSPDGSKIAFNGSPDFAISNGDIYTINPDGSGLLRITNNVGVSESSVRWSPDSSKFVYAETIRNAFRNRLVIVGKDGSFPFNSTGSGEVIISQFNWETRDGFTKSEPIWSRDGSSVIFMAQLTGIWRDYPDNSFRAYTDNGTLTKRQLYSFNLSTKLTHQYTDDLWWKFDPSAQP